MGKARERAQLPLASQYQPTATKVGVGGDELGVMRRCCATGPEFNANFIASFGACIAFVGDFNGRDYAIRPNPYTAHPRLPMLLTARSTNVLRFTFVCATVVATLLCAPRAALADPIPGTTCDPTEGGGNDADVLFFGAAFTCESLSGSYASGGGESNFFFFAGFTLVNELSFAEVLGDFDLFMTAFFVEVGNETFLSRIPDAFFPETMFTSYGSVWTYFRVETPTPVPGPGPDADFTPPWTQTITYFGDTTPNGPEVLRDDEPQGDTEEENGFNEVITFPGSFCGNCTPPIAFAKLPGDPTISGSADDFSDTTVVSTRAVPEPASLILMVGGVAALLYRRRRSLR